MTLREILEKVFGLIPRFKSRDELLEEEFSKFVADRVPEPPSAIPAIKTYFKAYFTSNRVRDIIDSRQFQDQNSKTFSVPLCFCGEEFGLIGMGAEAPCLFLDPKAPACSAKGGGWPLRRSKGGGTGIARLGGHERRRPPATLGARRHRAHRGFDCSSTTFNYTLPGTHINVIHLFMC
ncbi:MAG: hypothetical protein WCV99_19425 [Sterolibacterium sp.]